MTVSFRNNDQSPRDTATREAGSVVEPQPAYAQMAAQSVTPQSVTHSATQGDAQSANQAPDKTATQTAAGNAPADDPGDTLSNSSMARRHFLRSVGLPVALLGAATTVSPLLVRELGAKTTDSAATASPDTPSLAGSAAGESASVAASAERRWGLLIDTNKCASGCDACVRGCAEEHGIADTGNDATDAQWIRKLELQDRLSGRESSLPMLCQHCDSAPCVDVCPTGASFKRADGVVLVNKHTCIGCRYCMMACPYKARSFIHETLTEQKSWAPRGKGTVESCTLCVHRIDQSQGTRQTACADACTAEGHNAIVFGDLNDPQGELAQKIKAGAAVEVRADLRLHTGVRYINP